MIISWPGNLPENRQKDALVSAMDIFPTLAAITGQSVPSGLDGINLLPLLEGKADEVHKTLFFSNGRESWVVRHGPWKLAHNIAWDHSSFKIIDGVCVRDSNYHYPGGTLLYNLEQEIAEKQDLSDRYPELVDSLQILYGRWRSEMAEPTRP
jgi:arylsulfatase A-like enzyme